MGDVPAARLHDDLELEWLARIRDDDAQAFEALWRRLGLSVDWRLTYTTIGPTARRASQLDETFFERLRDEHGFDGGYTVVKDYVRISRARGRETFVPLSTTKIVPFTETSESGVCTSAPPPTRL